MDEQHIVTPEEAKKVIASLSKWTHGGTSGIDRALLQTVATEPERIRKAVDEALYAERKRIRQMTQEQIDTARGLW